MIGIAQRSECSFAKSYGGVTAERANSIQQTSDGGYIIAGWTDSFGAGNLDVSVLKIDAIGNIVWQKTYGAVLDEGAYSVQQTSDGGYIVAGWTESFGAGASDVLILKLDSSGNIIWQRTYGSTGYEAAHSIQQTTDGGYIVAGGTDSFGGPYEDIWVLKLNSIGDIIWQKTFGGDYTDYANSIQQTSDGGYIVAGWTNSFGAGELDYWVLKLNSSGDISWQRTYGGVSSEEANSIYQTSDGGYIVAGYTLSFGAGNFDILILKLDSNGDIEWQNTYGGPLDEDAFSIREISDNGFAIAASSNSFGAGNADALIMKLNNLGNIIWQNTYGGAFDEYALSIQQTSDGGYAIGGVSASFGAGGNDLWVLKLNSQGGIGQNCTIISNSAIVVLPASVYVINSQGIANSTYIAPAPSGLIALESLFSIETQCLDIPPGKIQNSLMVSKYGNNILLSWSEPPGACNIVAYGIYRGNLPIPPYNHINLVCNNSNTSYVDNSADGNHYYLVVPNNINAEGSYGSSFTGSKWLEIPQGNPFCYAQNIDPC